MSLDQDNVFGMVLQTILWCPQSCEYVPQSCEYTSVMRVCALLETPLSATADDKGHDDAYSKFAFRGQSLRSMLKSISKCPPAHSASFAPHQSSRTNGNGRSRTFPPPLLIVSVNSDVLFTACPFC